MYANHGDYTDNHRTIYTNNFYSISDGTVAKICNWEKQLISAVEHLPKEVDRITPLIQLIVATIAPSKIYMLKYPDVGTVLPDNYIDLLIVIPSKSDRPFTALQPILDMAYLNDARVNCSLHSEGSIIEGLRSGHIFYSLQCIQDNLIYDNSVTVYPVTPPDILNEKKKQAYLKFEQNFDNALDFHDCAVYLNENSTSYMTGFMLHQAVEFTFRGVLLGLSGSENKTHEISVLRKYVRRFAPQLDAIFSDDSEGEKRFLDILEDAYALPRDESNKISEGDLKVLFEKVDLLQDMAQKVVHSVLGFRESEKP